MYFNPSSSIVSIYRHIIYCDTLFFGTAKSREDTPNLNVLIDTSYLWCSVTVPIRYVILTMFGNRLNSQGSQDWSYSVTEAIR